MEDPRRDRPAEQAQPRRAGAAWPALPLLAFAAIPAAAAAGSAMGATPSWIVASGASALGVAATMLALGSRGGASARHAHDGAASGNGASTADGPGPAARRNMHGNTAAPAPAADESLLRRAIEIRCAERTAILENLADALLLVDAHGETRFANRAACELLGAEAGVAGTRAAVDALPPQVLRAVQGVSAARAGERRRIECELRNPDATPVVITVSSVKDGADALAAVVVRNVRAEREADRMKSEFVAKASHELRTPLASLRAYAEMLADGEVEDDAQRDHFIQVILDESGRLEALVDRMLDISRIESGISRARFEQVDLASLADDCVRAQQADAHRRRIALSVARRSAGAFAVADPHLLKQVLLNLLSNALKYTPDGGTVAVEVDIDNLARSVVVSVRDNGLGIPAHAIPQLFGKFFRVENHEKVAKGTGLGLNLCRNIVEAVHGGQIGVDSQVGVGSRFWFAIPLEQAGRKAA
jgi:PAS domain S-box-containing protein